MIAITQLIRQVIYHGMLPARCARRQQLQQINATSANTQAKRDTKQ